MFTTRRIFVLLLMPFALFKMDAQITKISIQSEIDSLVRAGLFSGTILQSKEGKVMYEASYGMANLSKNKKNTIGTQFNIGSINKFITKVIFAKMLQEELLSLSDIASEWVPELKKIDQGGEITVGHLLTMSSGLGDYLDMKEYKENKERYFNQDSFRELIPLQELSFSPGTSRQYSNLGYEVLGIIAEQIKKKSYFEIIQEYILRPANMTNTIFITSQSNNNRVAVGYINEDGSSLMPNWEFKPFASTAAGGAYSTVTDLSKLATALFQNKILNEEYTSLLFKNFNPKSRKKGSYVFAAGSGPGINATYYVNRKNKESLVILANLDSPAAKMVNEIFKKHSLNKNAKK